MGFQGLGFGEPRVALLAALTQNPKPKTLNPEPRVALIAAVVLPEGREGLELREDVGPELRHPALRARHVGKRGCRELIVVAI